MTIAASPSHTFKSIFFLIAFMSMFIFVCDALLWIFLPISPDGPAEKITYQQNLPGLKPLVAYDKNRYGLRSVSMTSRLKPINTIRILCLGASTTHQVTQETKDTWYALAETALNSHFRDRNVTIEIAGYGHGGFRAIDLALWAREYLESFSPDIVITLLGINDLLMNGGENYRYTGIDKLAAERGYGSARFYLKKYSQIYRRISYLLKRNSDQINLKSGKVVEWHSRNLPGLRKKYLLLPHVEVLSRNPDPINEFSDVMTWLAEDLTKKGVPLILLGQPVLWKDRMTTEELGRLWFPLQTRNGPVRPTTAWLANEMHRYNLVQSTISARYHNTSVTYIDLDSIVPKTLDYFFDDCHFTDLGSRTVAAAITPEVQRQVDLLLAGRRLQPIQSGR